MHHRIILGLVISVFVCANAFAQAVRDSTEVLVQKLGDPNPRIRMVAAMQLGDAIDPGKGALPPDAAALKAKLGEYYKSHRSELNHNMRESLCMILYPEIKRALEETVVASYDVGTVEVKNLLKDLANLATRNGAAPFDFGSIRIDASVPPEKLTIHSSNSFNNANGLEVLRFIAASMGCRYDIDDTGVFIYAEPKPPVPGAH